MSSTPPPIRAPLEAPPARQFLHSLAATTGWVVFLWWWWIVLHRVSAFEVRFTAWFLGVSLVLIVSATLVWARHNQGIHARKGPRTGLPVIEEDHSRDVLGRSIEYAESPEDCQQASIVLVRLEGDRKIYQPTVMGRRRTGSGAS